VSQKYVAVPQKRIPTPGPVRSMLIARFSTNNIVVFFEEHDLDGVYIDWEYPGMSAHERSGD
jgi:GH18 family chitinase